mmetsp:Transcript_8855/g.20497  ORF Transcript_8855/g.20497 Transcript_8855/m.20497 type:complete len:211 (+) Transcript_8855:249-881(+)
MTMLTRSMSMPRPKRLVATRIRNSLFLNAWYLLTRSFWVMEPLTCMEGKLQSWRSLSNSRLRATEETKMMTWLNSRASKSSVSLRFFLSAGTSTKYCWRPWRVSFPSSTLISRGSWRNLRQMGRILGSMVAENIMTCFSRGVARNTFMTWRRMSSDSRSLSHSSMMKNLTLDVSRCLVEMRSITRPGVPTTTLGGCALSSFSWFSRGIPP